jgi:hypothetical protein
MLRIHVYQQIASMVSKNPMRWSFPSGYALALTVARRTGTRVLGPECDLKANRPGANGLLTTFRAIAADDSEITWLNPQGSHSMLAASQLTLPGGIKIVHYHCIDSRPNRHKGELIHKLLGFKAGGREGPAFKAQGPRR